MNFESKQTGNYIIQKDKDDFNLSKRYNLNKNVDELSEKGDSNSNINKRKRISSQPELNISNKLSLEKENNNDLINDNIPKNNEPKNTDISDININNNEESIQNSTIIQKSTEVEENISNLYNNQLKKNYSYTTDQSSSNCKIIMNVISIINLGINIAIIVILIRIYKWTDENPLEEFDRKNYMTNEPTINISDELTNENIISDSIDISSDSGKNLLRRLNVDCNGLNDQFKTNGGKMHRVFDLGFDKVHKMALGILIIYCIILGIIVLTILISLIAKCCIWIVVCLIPLIPIIVLTSLFSRIIILILFIIMLVHFYKGYTTGEFLDYYKNCMERELQYDFISIYDDLNKLHKYVTALIILISLELFFSLIISCYEKKKNKNNY